MNSPGILPETGLPGGIVPLDSQVAGHLFNDEKNTIGVLKSPDGTVLKPLEKPLIGGREIKFYEELYTSTDPLILELQHYTPQYYGTTELQLQNKLVKFLVLEDITKGMSKPCVMDIKIGKRTWDPLADAAKKAREDTKYLECKNEYSFCIPGFQVYQLPSGSLKKFGKEYGKKLGKHGVKKAMDIFLNLVPGQPTCRHLVLQFLSTLQKILAFFLSQTKRRFYSSSILLAYDAEYLRREVQIPDVKLTKSYSSHTDHISPSGRHSETFGYHSKTQNNIRTSPMEHNEGCGDAKKNDSIFEMKEADEFPLATNTASTLPTMQNESSNKIERRQEFKENASVSIQKDCNLQLVVNGTEKLHRTQYQQKNSMKEIHSSLLNGHIAEGSRDPVRVYMIDFAHVFPSEDESLDTNYLQGIENLMNLLETYLILE